QHQLLDWQPVAEPTVITDPTQQVVTSWTRTSTVVNPALIAAA
ncbi:pyridoxal-5'-phosphate-dependent protein subunit beta, partial [Mycobacterium sp. WUMAC-067]|nr:pyridoxal-5'-phosphate-dependent protein subunit beta [Mycobacterium sp. WUMAC-067]